MPARSTPDDEGQQVLTRDMIVAITDLVKSVNAELLDSSKAMMEQAVQGRPTARITPQEAWRTIWGDRARFAAETDYLLLRQGLGRRGAHTLELRHDPELGTWSIISEQLVGAIGLAFGFPDGSGGIAYEVSSLQDVTERWYVLDRSADEGPVTLLTFDEHRITAAWQGHLTPVEPTPAALR